MTFHSKSIQESVSRLNSSIDGLSKSEAAEFLLEYGENVVTVRGEPLWRKIIEPFIDIFMFVLFLAVIVSVWHGAITDSLIIAAIMITNAVIYYIQRFSTERILRSLQKHNKLITSVLREKQVIKIDSSQLVPGDVIILNEGEKIPADARLISVNSFRVDESQLTGESLPISKQVDELSEETEVYDQSNMVFQGSFVVGGSAKAIIVATGNNTEFGKLAILSINTTKKSPVQAKIDKLISGIIKVIAIIAAITLPLAIYRGMDVAESIRYVLALSVSAVPESLPVAITVVLVFGMRRMAKKKALVKAVNAIQTVGCLTMIATDKTGTLTKNQLTVQDVWSVHPDNQLLKQSIERSINVSDSKTYDPLDIALINFISTSKHGARHNEVAILPFNQTYSMSGNILEIDGKNSLYIKGAPESILSRSKITKDDHEKAMSVLHSMAGDGFRVIALAHRSDVKVISSFDELGAEKNFVFDGFVAVADILRDEAKGAIAQAQHAGINVSMITGDHFETAFHIGKKLGIVETKDQVFDSRKMNNLSDSELSDAIKDVRVFARVTPENKFRILSIYKNSHIVAMTGDGVNDVPALSNAHVGVAMGSGASIAKDAGSIILLDNNFKSIISAVHEGRTIYANIKRMVAYLLSTNAGEVLIALGALIVGIPVPLLPVQILWVNLVTDTFLVIPLGLEPGEKRNMKKPPQSPNAPLFSRFMISRIVLVAITMMTLTTFIYVTEAGRSSLDYARTSAFHALVVMQWVSAFCYRSDYESIFIRIKRFNPAFFVGLAIAISVQMIAMTGLLSDVLHLEKMLISDIFSVTMISIIIPLTVVELHKWIGRRFFKKGHRT
jgi:P-type Ca2+ transporter type 2C